MTDITPNDINTAPAPMTQEDLEKLLAMKPILMSTDDADEAEEDKVLN